MNSGAQGAIEYLLIIGAAIIVVAVVIVAITTVSNSGDDQIGTVPSHANDPLKEASGNYIKISNYYYPKTELGQGLVGLWHFDEGSGTTTADSSGKGNIGALVNSPVWAGGRFGKALSFNGSFVNVGRGASLNIPGDITLEAWVNPAGVLQKSYAGIIVGRGPIEPPEYLGSGQSDYAMDINGNPNGGGNWFRFNYFRSPNNWYDPASTLLAGIIPAGSWTQMVVTRNVSEGKLRYYKNGVLIETFSGYYAGDGQPNNSKVIGADTHQGVNGNYNGLIDEVAIWNRALSASEIQTLYANSQ